MSALVSMAEPLHTSEAFPVSHSAISAESFAGRIFVVEVEDS